VSFGFSNIQPAQSLTTLGVIMKKALIILSVLFVFSSCSVSHDFLKSKNTSAIYHDISGVYQNRSGSKSLWNQINGNIWGEDSLNSDVLIRIDVSKRNLNCSLLDSGKAIKSVKLEGRFKDGYFISRQSTTSGIYGILWRLDGNKLFLALNKENGNLQVESVLSSTGFLTLLPLPLNGYNDLNQYHKSN
jgi:hypothetical protein